ncbi:hypothetical protein EDF56_104344 [Novosphingobium sp. PhB165]|nr:hypothetical protein EDF56_104344 [Novosphingobium sp. PhB165]
MDTPVSKVARAAFVSVTAMAGFVVWFGLAGFGGAI